jgi:hypothetical protein
VAGMFQHLPFLLKDRILPSGLLVGVVNQYDLQRILRSWCTSCAAKARRCCNWIMRSLPTLRPAQRTSFRIAHKCYVGLVGKSSRLLGGVRGTLVIRFLDYLPCF